MKSAPPPRRSWCTVDGSRSAKRAVAPSSSSSTGWHPRTTPGIRHSPNCPATAASWPRTFLATGRRRRRLVTTRSAHTPAFCETSSTLSATVRRQSLDIHWVVASHCSSPTNSPNAATDSSSSPPADWAATSVRCCEPRHFRGPSLSWRWSLTVTSPRWDVASDDGFTGRVFVPRAPAPPRRSVRRCRRCRAPTRRASSPSW